ASAPIVLARPPFSRQPAAAFHSLERLVEGAVVYAERSAGPILEPGGYAVPVHRAPAERFEDQEIECALEEGQGIRVVGHSAFPVSAKGNDIHWLDIVKAMGRADVNQWVHARGRSCVAHTVAGRQSSHSEPRRAR